MTNLSDPHEFRDLEQAALTLAARIRQLKEAMRSLAVLGQEVAGLREALVSVSPDVLEELNDVEPAKGSPGQADDPSLARNDGRRAAVAHLIAGANGMHSGSTNGAEGEGDTIANSSSGGFVLPRRTEPSVAVTVSTQGGSVDLVRLYRALQRMPQIEELNLTSYSGGRAVVGLITATPPRELPIEETLRHAFPEGLVGDWIGDAEFVAVITSG